MGHVLKDLTELTTVSAIQGTVDLIVKISASHVCFGHVIMEGNVFQKERNVFVYVRLPTYRQTVTLPNLIYVIRTHAKMAANASFCRRKMITSARTALECLVERTVQNVTVPRPKECKMTLALS